ncbi:hypothetical protein C8R44DRAFT_692486 [Mycena epipterygia]|nr:hypothetical protein C8R44DRAFT_692486 [Mycena epipterygia]
MKLSLVVYPVLTLPPEIISRIFVESLPSHGRVRPSAYMPPLTLAQICGQWRDIALSTPELWSSVDLAFASRRTPEGSLILNREEPNPGAHPLLETWLSRAKGRPLSLTVRSSHEAIPLQILSIILFVSQQLEHLELQLSSADFRRLQQNHILFPRLRRLALYIPNVDAPESLFSLFENTPTLCNLAFLGRPAWVPRLKRYPLLTSIELQNIAVQTLFDILNQLPQLLHFTAYLDLLDPMSPSLPMTTAPYLQSLILTGAPRPATYALESLKLPGLRRLEMPHISKLTSFLARSSCVLEHLTTRYAAYEGSDFIDCLKAIPSITSLDIELNEDIGDFVQNLAIHSWLLPHLCILTLRVIYVDSNYSPMHLLDLLHVRRNPPGSNATKLSLFQLHLPWDDYKDDDWIRDDLVLTKFDELIAQGLTVELDYGDGTHWPVRRTVDLCGAFP